MNPAVSHFSIHGASRLAALFGTASFLALGAATANAQAPAAPAAPAAAAPANIEEVLVTGSLIRGAAAVGAPVTVLSDQDFKETGSLTVADVLKSIPAIEVQASNSVTNGGGSIEKAQGVQIHGLGTGSGVETLMMVDGMRYPVQGHGTCYVDPSIIPQLAVERIDVLADGASATYGSDAVAGVINVVLKRGFDGATTQFRVGESTDLGGLSVQATQLFGRKWDDGDITVSYEFYDQQGIRGPARSYYTYNFEPFGLNDITPLADMSPGIVTTGSVATVASAPAGFSGSVGARFCANCYSVPKGQNGIGLTWNQLLANKGVNNEINPYSFSDILPREQRNAATLTFDQQVMPGIQFFASGFYSNRRALQAYPPGGSPGKENAIAARPVPTTNPYYPIGAPAGLRISYNLGAELDPRVSAAEIAGRYDFGFNLDLPFDWHGKIYYSKSEDQNFAHATNMTNTNMILAALGNTVAAGGGLASFTKPANIPYLNLFCDPNAFTCNSDATLNYIRAFRNYDERWNLNEYGGTFDGDLFDLPGGTLKGAVGGNFIRNDWVFKDYENFAAQSTTVPSDSVDPEGNNVWALFGQLNVPIIGEANKIPLVEAFNVELAYRHDQYNKFGGVNTPKIAVDWRVGYGLTLRGTWGKSFRAPGFSEASAFAGVMIQSQNVLGGGSTNTLPTCTAGVPVQAGSLASILNPTCSANQSLLYPGGIFIGGGAGGAVIVRNAAASALRKGFVPAETIGPETAKNYALGLNFAPEDGLLKGLAVDVTKYHIRIDNLISDNTPGTGPNDAASIGQYIVIPDANQPITAAVNAPFLALVQSVYGSPRSNADPSFLNSIKFIQDQAITNIGYREVEGIDFDARYDWDMGDIGAFNVGISGNYETRDDTQAYPGGPIDSVYVGKNSGSPLKWRTRLGWTDGTWSVTGFVNRHGHSSNNATATTPFTPPPCYYATGFSAGSCYAGSPYYGPANVFPNFSASQYTYDLSIGYQTGTMPANEYLQNIGIQLTVLNVLNKTPPFIYDSRSRSGLPRAFQTDYGFDPMQRTVDLIVTKNW